MAQSLLQVATVYTGQLSCLPKPKSFKCLRANRLCSAQTAPSVVMIPCKEFFERYLFQRLFKVFFYIYNESWIFTAKILRMNTLFVRSIYLQFLKRYLVLLFFCGLRCVSRSLDYVAYSGFFIFQNKVE
jgi:hypothetical protein